jgi:hypothetical protein
VQRTENAALSNLRNKTYDLKRAVYFSCLKNANVPRDLLIHEGISELKIKTNNPELKRKKKKLHNNLSYYALISAGEIKKSTMRGFEEINLALAAHVLN